MEKKEQLNNLFLHNGIQGFIALSYDLIVIYNHNWLLCTTKALRVHYCVGYWHVADKWQVPYRYQEQLLVDDITYIRSNYPNGLIVLDHPWKYFKATKKKKKHEWSHQLNVWVIHDCVFKEVDIHTQLMHLT